MSTKLRQDSRYFWKWLGRCLVAAALSSTKRQKRIDLVRAFIFPAWQTRFTWFGRIAVKWNLSNTSQSLANAPDITHTPQLGGVGNSRCFHLSCGNMCKPDKAMYRYNMVQLQFSCNTHLLQPLALGISILHSRIGEPYEWNWSWLGLQHLQGWKQDETASPSAQTERLVTLLFHQQTLWPNGQGPDHLTHLTRWDCAILCSYAAIHRCAIS